MPREPRLQDQVEGPELLKAMLKSRGSSQSQIARDYSFHAPQVHHCIHGDYEHPEIRDAIAEVLGIPRSQVDAMIPTKGGGR